MTQLLREVLDSAGITRDELRELVLARRAQEREREQRALDEQLLALGREFQEEARARREAPRARLAVVRAPRARREPPPVLESDRCSAYRCGNAAVDLVTDVINGRALRVPYCDPHGSERRAELAVAGQERRL